MITDPHIIIIDLIIMEIITITNHTIAMDINQLIVFTGEQDPVITQDMVDTDISQDIINS